MWRGCKAHIESTQRVHGAYAEGVQRAVVGTISQCMLRHLEGMQRACKGCVEGVQRAHGRCVMGCGNEHWPKHASALGGHA